MWQLVNDLTKDYDKEEYKARAIFTWIADNIAYDYKAFNKGKHYPVPKCKKGKDCDIIIAKWKENYTDKVLRQRKSVCDGYSWLFKRMCDLAGLQTDFVPGYTKNSPEAVGRMGSLNHAWNGIILDGKYYYLDVTWAAGSCGINDKGKLDGFFKAFNDFYWLTPVDKFCQNHYPEDKNSPGVKEYSIEKYRNNPYIIRDYLDTIDVISPSSGIINAKLGDTIKFVIRHGYKVWDLHLNTNTNRNPFIYPNGKSVYKTLGYSAEDEEKFEKYRLPFKQEGGIVSFEIVVKNKNLRTIELYLNRLNELAFRVRVIK